MSLLFVRHSSAVDGKTPESALSALLNRMRQRLYPETLPVLASCWLKTLCSSGHNRVWWERLRNGMDRALLDLPLHEFSRAVLISARNWTDNMLSAAGDPPHAKPQLQPPFRTFASERLVPYIVRLLNEWLPTEVAYCLMQQEDWAGEPDEGIPVLARAKALDRLLIRERFSPETLEMFLSPSILSPKSVYPADVEILRDVVLSLLGRVSAAPLPVLPAELLGVATGAALPSCYEDAVRRASLHQSEEGGDELHVPITDVQALAILQHDPVRIGSVIVTMDGREWMPSNLDRSDGNRIVYRPGEHLRIDCTADHAKLAIQWPGIPLSWSGSVARVGPFELFGREWHSASWELDGQNTLLHLTFSRVLSIADPQPAVSEREHLHSANVEMAWSELERALAESVSQKSREPVEHMRRTELVPMGRALYALAESFDSAWPGRAKQIDTHLRAARYHHAAVVSEYGRAPWRILPLSVQSMLARGSFRPEGIELLSGIFADMPVPHSPSPSQAA